MPKDYFYRTSAIFRLLRTASLALTASFTPVLNAADNLQSIREIIADPASSSDDIDAAIQSLGERLGDRPEAERAERLYLLGSANLISLAMPKEARPYFKAAREGSPPGTTLWKESTFGLALSLQTLTPVTPQSIAEAAGYYNEILVHDQSSNLAARTLINLGRIDEVFDYAGDIQDPKSARKHYKQVIEGWPGSAAAAEAAMRYGSTLIQEGYSPLTSGKVTADPQSRMDRILSGASFMRDWVTQYPDSTLAAGIWEYIGNTYLITPEVHPEHGHWEHEALRAYLHATGDAALLNDGEPATVKGNLDKIDRGYLYIRIAALAQRLGYRKIAFEYYCRLIAETPANTRCAEAALQLTENLGYTQDAIRSRVAKVLNGLGYTALETSHVVKNIIFLDPPATGNIPTP